MSELTRVALVQSREAMWNYDPRLPENEVSAGGLDVIAMIRTLAIKVRQLLFSSRPEALTLLHQIQASGVRKEVFFKIQTDAGVKTPTGIPLHSNTRWGSALKMCMRAYEHRDVSIRISRARDMLTV